MGLKVGAISRGRYEHRIRELAEGNPMLEAATGPMLRARASLRLELARLERHVSQLAQEDPVCRRLMSMPGVDAVVALTYRSAVDDPARFTSSKKVGPWVGMTPSRNQSGERDVSGGITKAGDVNLRRALCQAATVMMYEEGQKTVQWTVFPTIGRRSTWLRTWAAQVARRLGAKRAMVALARRTSVILHRMWVDDTDFRLDTAVALTALTLAIPTVACLTAGLRGPPRDVVPMMPWSGLLPINVKHAYEMGTSELHLNQHHVGSHRADHGPKHAPRMISDEGGDNRKTAEKQNTVKTAIMRTDAHVEKRLTGTTPLPKSGT